MGKIVGIDKGNKDIEPIYGTNPPSQWVDDGGKSINESFFGNLSGIKPGVTYGGGFDYDPITGELTEKGKKQQQGWFMAKQITGQDVGQSGADMQKIKKMREDMLGKNSADAQLSARTAGDKFAKANQQAGMKGVDTAGLIADSAARNQMAAASLNQQSQATALDKFAQNVMTMAGINLSTIQGYENMAEAVKPLPVVQYSGGGLFG